MDNNTNNNTQPTDNGVGGAAANQPANQAANNTTPDMGTLAQTLIDAVQKRTARAESSVVKSIAEQYNMTEAEVAAILSKARDEKASALPEDVQKRINEATEKANERLIAAEVKTLGNAMGMVDAEIVLMMIDRKKVKVEDNGTVTGVQEALDALKTAKPVLFGASNNAWGQKQGGSATTTKADIMKIRDPIERQNQIAKNLELFK